MLVSVLDSDLALVLPESAIVLVLVDELALELVDKLALVFVLVLVLELVDAWGIKEVEVVAEKARISIGCGSALVLPSKAPKKIKYRKYEDMRRKNKLWGEYENIGLNSLV